MHRKNEGRKRIRSALTIAALLLLVLFGAWRLLLHQRYQAAEESFARGDYAAAQAAFARLGAYRDAPERANEAGYLDAQELLTQERFAPAAEAFAALGGYRDAAALAAQAAELASQEQTYLAADEVLLSGDYALAYRLYASVPAFRDAEEQRQHAADLIYGAAFTLADTGDYAAALAQADTLRAIGDARADDLPAELAARERFEPVTDEPELPAAQPLVRFGSGTTAAAYAELFSWMFGSGTTAATLYADAADRVPKGEIDALMARVLEGYDRAEEEFPDLGSIYAEAGVRVVDNGSVATRVSIRTNADNAWSDEELSAHARGFARYCADSLQAMMDTLRIGRSQSAEQRSRAVYDFVMQTLAYDSSHSVHDAYAALEGGTGVCESYASLYCRMCRLAGVPTRAMIGMAGGEKHIWCVQWDEDGTPLYTDPTWGDQSGAEGDRYFRSAVLWPTHTPDRPQEKS